MTQTTGRPEDRYAWAGPSGATDQPGGTATAGSATGSSATSASTTEAGGTGASGTGPHSGSGNSGTAQAPGSPTPPAYPPTYSPPTQPSPQWYGQSQPTQPLPSPPQPGFGQQPPPPGGPSAGGDPSPHAPRRGRRPGWTGVLAVGAGAAILSSALTAGLVTATQDRTSPTASPSTALNSPTPNVQAPVTGSSATSPDWQKVAAAVQPSVVSVKVSGAGGSGEGSGVVLDSSGRILTNNHVVTAANGGSLSVVLYDGRGYAATIVGTDPSTDLAVIKLKTAPSGLKPAVLGSSSSVKVGDPVMAVGNPLGLSSTVTTGIVSALDRPVTTQAQPQNPFSGSSSGETVVTNAIQTDAAINPGNSGGALVDAQGRVIGINSSIATLSGGAGSESGSIGLGFAIPIDEAKDVASQLSSGGSVQHAWLGVQPDDGTVTLDGAQREAALIARVLDGGPAQKAGLKNDDAVIAVNGHSVTSAESLVGTLRESRPNAKVTLTVVRDGKTLDIQVTLGTRPQS